MNYWSTVWEGFQKVSGIASTLVALTIGVAAKMATDEVVPVWLVASLVPLTVVIVATFAAALSIALKSHGLRHQTVDQAVAVDPPYFCPHMFLAKSRPFLTIGVRLLFLRRDGDHERNVGTGAVRQIQEDGRVLVSIDEVNNYVDNKEFLKRITAKDAECVKQLRFTVIGYSHVLPGSTDNRVGPDVGEDAR